MLPAVVRMATAVSAGAAAMVVEGPPGAGKDRRGLRGGERGQVAAGDRTLPSGSLVGGGPGRMGRHPRWATLTGSMTKSGPKIGSSVFALIIGVTICPDELKTALAWVKRELPNFALTGVGSSKFKGARRPSGNGLDRKVDRADGADCRSDPRLHGCRLHALIWVWNRHRNPETRVLSRLARPSR
jgi:hypothetical protein